MLFQNDGQRPKKSWAMFSKTTGNVFQNYGQRFSKRWAMFFDATGNVFGTQRESLIFYCYFCCSISITISFCNQLRQKNNEEIRCGFVAIPACSRRRGGAEWRQTCRTERDNRWEIPSGDGYWRDAFPAGWRALHGYECGAGYDHQVCVSYREPRGYPFQRTKGS